MPRSHPRTLALSALLLAAPLWTACHDENQTTGGVCDSNMDLGSIASTSPGEVTATGGFPDDESVLARYTVNGQQRLAVGVVSGETVTFTGLPSGSVRITFVVSCDQVQEDLATVTVQVD